MKLGPSTKKAIRDYRANGFTPRGIAVTLDLEESDVKQYFRELDLAAKRKLTPEEKAERRDRELELNRKNERLKERNELIRNPPMELVHEKYNGDVDYFQSCMIRIFGV